MSETRRASVDDAFFWDGAAEGRLLVQRCTDCGTLRHPPGTDVRQLRFAVERCRRGERSGARRVVDHSLHPNRPDDEPRIVVLVQLEEGTRLVANLVDPPDAGPYEDRPVQVDFHDVGGTAMPCFRISA